MVKSTIPSWVESRDDKDRPSVKVARHPVSDHAANYVRDLILDGVLKPGTKIAQEEIARELGISRIPLREALIALEQEGWLSFRPHKGAFVNELRAQAVKDHYELYGLLLGFATRIGIERTGPELVKELEAIRDAFAQSSESSEQRRCAVEFNRVIVDSACSVRLRRLLKTMRGLPLEQYFEWVDAGAEMQLREIDVIVEGVRRGDGEQAAAAYERLMNRAGIEAIKLLLERGVIGLTEDAGLDSF